MSSPMIVFSLLSASFLLAQASYTPLPLQGAPSDNSLDKTDIATGPYSAPAPYANYVDQGAVEGYTIQSGYEGYLVPYEDLEPALHLLETKGFIAAGLKLVHTVPKLALKVIFKAIPHVLFIGAVVLIGGALTAAVCTFTSFCSYGFLPSIIHKFNKEQVRSFGSYISEDKLNAASHYVKTAIDNYYQSVGMKKTSRSKKQ